MTKNHFEQHTVAKVILVQKFDIKFKVLTILKSVKNKVVKLIFRTRIDVLPQCAH